MKTNAILLAAIGVSLAACATTAPPNDVFAAAHVRPTVSTRSDVDKLLGKPVQTYVLKETKGTQATYNYKDLWGYDMELHVTYDEKGIVVARYAEREDR